MDDEVFKALADPTRRALLDALLEGPRTTGELCALHDEMTRFGVMNHMRILEECGLIVVHRVGRSRLNYLNPVPIREVYVRWVRPIAEAPADELLRLKATAEARADVDDVRDARSRTRSKERKGA
jgi:DNA-binding transcriptional ArsR family regulator